MSENIRCVYCGKDFNKFQALATHLKFKHKIDSPNQTMIATWIPNTVLAYINNLVKMNLVGNRSEGIRMLLQMGIQTYHPEYLEIQKEMNYQIKEE